jgi:hypothetical protein
MIGPAGLITVNNPSVAECIDVTQPCQPGTTVIRPSTKEPVKEKLRFGMDREKSGIRERGLLFSVG